MSARRLFDCFVFKDELDLLELRLRTAYPFVDAFVLVESDRTFSGQRKPLVFAEERERFAPWADKIRHVVVDDMPHDPEWRWAAEIHQRDALLRGLDDARPEDLVIVADVDEIVYPEVLASLKGAHGGPSSLEMSRTFRFANWELPATRCAVVFDLEHLERPHSQRNYHRPARRIVDAGKHFTSLGSVDAIATKFEDYSHSEMDNSQQKAESYLARAQGLGVDVFSKKLVRQVGPAGLCELQRELMATRPDLFEFAALPPRHQRMTFSWYAKWRARQRLDSPLVSDLDSNYDSRRIAVPAVAGLAVARQALWGFPRGVAHQAKVRMKRDPASSAAAR